MDISWFMLVVNEGIARQANVEDECTGRFWPLLRIPAFAVLEHPCSSEGRFKSQALLDEASLMACLAYIGLYPIAQNGKDPGGAYTHQCQATNPADPSPNHPQQQVKGPVEFVGNPRAGMPKGLPFKLTDYLELVDWSGRIIREGKRGYIDQSIPPILERLNIEPEHWGYLINHFESRFKSFVDTAFKLKQVCHSLGYQRTPGIKHCEYYFP